MVIKISDKLFKAAAVTDIALQFLSKVARQRGLGTQKAQVQCNDCLSNRFIKKFDILYQTGLRTNAVVTCKSHLFQRIAPGA